MWVHRKFIQFSNMHIFCLDQPIFYNVIDSYLFAAYLCDFSLCWIASESIKIMLYFNFFLKRQSKVCLNPSGTFANFFCVTVKQTFSAVTCHTSSFREEAGVDSPPPLQPRSCCQPLHHPCTAVRHSALVSSLQRCLWFYSAAQSSCLHMPAKFVYGMAADIENCPDQEERRPGWRWNIVALAHIGKWGRCILHR